MMGFSLVRAWRLHTPDNRAVEAPVILHLLAYNFQFRSLLHRPYKKAFP